MGVFGDLNEVKLIGNMTNDLELRHVPSGRAVVSFGLATNRSYRSNDEWKEEVTFHNIVVWGNDAEYLSQRARKGTRVFIGGRLNTRSWEDSEGVKKYKTEVIVYKIILLSRYEKGNDNNNGQGDNNNDGSSSSGDNSIDPDDLPF